MNTIPSSKPSAIPIVVPLEIYGIIIGTIPGYIPGAMLDVFQALYTLSMLNVFLLKIHGAIHVTNLGLIYGAMLFMTFF